MSYRFICFTDDPISGVECREPPCDLGSWWGKLGFFRPDLDVDYPMLYLDLDVVITGQLDDLFCGKDFAIIRQTKKIVSPKTVPGYNSSAMLFGRPGCRSGVWQAFDTPAMYRFRGDQDWLKHTRPIEYTWPDDWFAHVEQCQLGSPASCKVVLCNAVKNTEAAKSIPWIERQWQ